MPPAQEEAPSPAQEGAPPPAHMQAPPQVFFSEDQVACMMRMLQQAMQRVTYI